MAPAQGVADEAGEEAGAGETLDEAMLVDHHPAEAHERGVQAQDEGFHDAAPKM